MKRLFSVLPVVIIVVVFIPFRTSAKLNVHSIDECNKKLFALNNDLLDICKNKSIDGDSIDHAIEVISALEFSQALLDHLHDLLSILDIVTKDSDRDFVMQCLHLQTQYMIKNCNLEIKRINNEMAHINNNAIISICDQAKTELRKLQDILH
jgi:hypothetical protein